MEQKIAFNTAANTYLSKHGLYGKIIFWVFFGVFALELIFVSISYFIFVDNDPNMIDLATLLVAGVMSSTTISITMILFIRWLILSEKSHIITRSTADHNILQDLKAAMEKSELSLHYQAQVDLKSGEILGMEALIRWDHFEKGFISPAIFIPLAEQSGLIEAIDSWVLRVACTQTKKWLDQGFNLKIAVNLSAMLFKNSNIVDTVKKILQETHLPPANLELELTETVMIKDMDNAIDIMRRLSALGIIMSMDDFGTGYATLANLDRFPIQKLKIDKIFVHSLNQYSDDPNIADSIIGIGHHLNLTILAEGIETEYQRNYFANLGCHQGQGYFFYEPMPASEFFKLLNG